MHNHVIARAVVWVADYKCSEREQFETVAPIDRQMKRCLLRSRAPTSRSGVFRLCPSLILSFSSLLCSDALLVGIAMHPVCVAAMPFCFRISHCHVGWDHPLGFFTNSKTRRWYRSITIEIMILFHAPDPVPLSVPVYTPFF